MNFGAETHLGDGVMSAFVFPSTAIAYSSQERPTKILTILPWLLSCT